MFAYTQLFSPMSMFTISFTKTEINAHMHRHIHIFTNTEMLNFCTHVSTHTYTTTIVHIHRFIHIEDTLIYLT